MTHSHKPRHEYLKQVGQTFKPDGKLIYLIWVGVISSVTLDPICSLFVKRAGGDLLSS